MNKFSEIEVTKKDVQFYLTLHMVFKRFFQNVSLSIINAHRSLTKRLRGREQRQGESSEFSHLLGVVAASHA